TASTESVSYIELIVKALAACAKIALICCDLRGWPEEDAAVIEPEYTNRFRARGIGPNPELHIHTSLVTCKLNNEWQYINRFVWFTQQRKGRRQFMLKPETSMHTKNAGD
ncbi:hypothetical protein HW555_000958, partial [Spodoptera exigua]